MLLWLDEECLRFIGSSNEAQIQVHLFKVTLLFLLVIITQSSSNKKHSNDLLSCCPLNNVVFSIFFCFPPLNWDIYSAHKLCWLNASRLAGSPLALEGKIRSSSDFTIVISLIKKHHSMVEKIRSVFSLFLLLLNSFLFLIFQTAIKIN